MIFVLAAIANRLRNNNLTTSCKNAVRSSAIIRHKSSSYVEFFELRASQAFLFCDPISKNKFLWDPIMCRLILR